MKKHIYILAAFFGLGVGMSHAQVQKGSVLIKNATVLTVTKGNLESSDVLVQNGVITQIGKNLSAPAGVSAIDATGKYLMPGIIDAHSHVGLDVVNPQDLGIYRALAGGVTVSHAMHGSANVVGGQNATLKHRWGSEDPADIIMQEAPRTIKFALGENPTRVHGRGNGIQPRSRMGVEAVIRNGFKRRFSIKRLGRNTPLPRLKKVIRLPLLLTANVFRHLRIS